MPNVLAIITDLGGVLIDVDQQEMCAKLAKYSSLSAHQISGHFSPRVLKGLELDFGRGLMTVLQLYEQLSRELKLTGLSFKDFIRIYSDRFTRKEESLALFRQLSRKYPIAMLSNTNEAHYRYWSKALGKDMNLFKEVILSFQVGYIKPDPRIYSTAAKRLGVELQQCVCIDDVQEYVDAAKQLGMRGIRFVSARQLKAALGKSGVKLGVKA